jgi:hypothetical protein
MSNRYYFGLFLATVPWTALTLSYNTWLGVSLLPVQILGLFLMHKFSKDKA